MTSRLSQYSVENLKCAGHTRGHAMTWPRDGRHYSGLTMGVHDDRPTCCNWKFVHDKTNAINTSYMHSRGFVMPKNAFAAGNPVGSRPFKPKFRYPGDVTGKFWGFKPLRHVETVWKNPVTSRRQARLRRSNAICERARQADFGGSRVTRSPRLVGMRLAVLPKNSGLGPRPPPPAPQLQFLQHR